MRIFRGLITLGSAWMVSACSGPSGETPTAQKADIVPCAWEAGATMAPDCSIAAFDTPDGLDIVITHRRKGFRRLLIARDGKGLRVADGTQDAVVRAQLDGRQLVTVGDQIFSLPASLRPTAR